MSLYADLVQLTGSDDLKGYLPEASETATQNQLEQLIERASRRIDAYVTGARETDIFAATSAITTRIVRGSGLSYLDLPAHVLGSVQAVTVPSGYTVPDFEQIEGSLQIVDAASGRAIRGRIWLSGLPYSVSAKFGSRFEVVPPEINEACLQIVVRLFRSQDDAFSGVIGNINSDQTIFERTLPSAAKEILDNHKKAYRARRFSFA